MVTYNKQEYLSFYGLERWGFIHNSEIITCHQHDIFIQTFLPEKNKGLVTIVHGYLDHSGALTNIIHTLVSDGYGVITFDLPGHGHSKGDRGDINDFSEYVQVLHAVHSHITQKGITHKRWSIMGHSTGAAIILTYMNEYTCTFEKVILVAPLIQPYLWSFSKFGVKLIGEKKFHLNRTFRKNSSDQEYLALVKKDPLQFTKLPIRWLQSLERWNNSLSEQLSGSEKALFIIQGNKDTTVNWRYNLKFIFNKYPNSTCVLIDGGNHQLFNETAIIRDITFTHIKRYLSAIGDNKDRRE
ncbi:MULTISPECIES: alpha/beta hydrolase [Bacillaceae]|uniref:Alpha/beta hydrolase n=2 Tax=Bacillales TaxID=1385 RepID=A0A5D4TCW0_9BACI|nr:MULTISPECIES: alpha/beta hydrolase [Bacillaceae]TYS73125.1 alpha/beta hydrolase [Sutcliffiella horikoshii]